MIFAKIVAPIAASYLSPTSPLHFCRLSPTLHFYHPRVPAIRVLPHLVANQIAAGEVVERPASVVKELLENALDACAKRITVDLEQGGLELIRVGDDGQGIPANELSLALAPHATSKVTSAADLAHIATLGFRGEALASITSVSRLTIRSRTASDVAATEVHAEGEAATPAAPAAGPVGTCVTVRNLFFNTPARRKFLRSVSTEQERCAEVLRQTSLAHPDIGFRLTCDGRVAIDLLHAQSPRERALAVLGKELSPQLLDLHADSFDDARGLSLWGLAGLPSIAKGTSKSQFVFVNGRPVRDRTIQHAIAEAYRGLLDPSRYPLVLLMLDMSPEGVDVNVHPQKTEVRFRDSSLVHSVVLRTIRDALRRADLTPAFHELKPSPHLPADLPGSGLESLAAVTSNAPARFVDFFRRHDPATPQTALPLPTPPENGHTAPNNAEAFVPTSNRVLQVHKSYLVTQDDQGVVIIDQHALHERVMFEYLLHRVTSGESPLECQHLLSPVLVPATASQLDRLPALTPLLQRIGIDAQPFGPSTLALHAFPSFLLSRGVEPGPFLEAILAKSEDLALLANEQGGHESALREVLDMMSCKAAVKAGDHLTDPELADLITLRHDVDRSSNCPHGRPTSIRLTIRELEKLFGRA